MFSSFTRSGNLEHISGETVVRARTDIATAALQGEVVMLHPESARYYSLNAVGTRIWELIQSPITVAELVSRILGEYEVDRERLESDVFRLLSELLDAELAEAIGAGG